MYNVIMLSVILNSFPNLNTITLSFNHNIMDFFLDKELISL